MSHSHSHGEHGHPHHPHAGEGDGLAEMLDLDAVVLHASWNRIFERLQAAVGAPRRIADLGAGTGTGTIALAGRFPAAAVTAVDVDPQLPYRLARAAATAGVADRVRARVADLDAGWPPLGALDLVWASMSLHHLKDPDAVLREARAAIVEGGVFATIEFDAPLTFLAEGSEAARAEQQALAAMRAKQAEVLPQLGSQWAPRFERAGFTVEATHEIAIDVRAPLAAKAGRYASLWLRRLAEGGDVAALRALAEHDVSPQMLHVRGVRTLTIARRGQGT